MGPTGSSYSASGGNAGPSTASLGSSSAVNIGGNTGIGSSSGLSTSMIMMIGVVVVAYLLFKR